MDYVPQTSVRDLAFIVFKRKWSILVILGTVLFGSVAWLWLIRDDVYGVSAKVLVRVGREEAPSAASTLGSQPPMVVGYRYQDVNSELDVLQSTELLAKVVDDLHLDKPGPQAPVPQQFIPRLRYRVKSAVRWFKDWEEEFLIRIGLRERLTPREKAIAMLQQGLSVKTDKDSNVFVAILVLPMRRGSSIVLNDLLDKYQDFRLKLYHDNSVTFFQQEVNDGGAKLRKAESNLRTFEVSANINSMDKQKDVLLDAIARAEVLVKESDLARAESAAKVQRLDAELSKEDPNFGALGEFDRDSFPQELLRQLAELQREREHLRMTELDSGDRIQNNRRQFNTISGLLAANLHSVLAEKEANAQRQRDALMRLESELEELHGNQAQWVDLSRNVKQLEENYLFYQRKLEETSANSILDSERVGNVAVVEHAIDAFAPYGFQKVTLLGLALAGGIVAVFAWMAVAEFFDHKIYSSDVLEKHVPAPVLAVVPISKSARISLGGKSGIVRGMLGIESATRSYAGER
jgi:uncharacterized protein involved in exopolysaccharide biosynthesis